MAKLTKKAKAVQGKVDSTKLYPLDQALALVRDCATAKFDESIDVAVQLGIDAKKSDLSQYKAELLAKVDERLQEIEHAHEKEAQVQKFSDEMKIKVREHEAHLADRAKMMESVKDDIIKSAKNFYGGAYCVDENA